MVKVDEAFEVRFKVGKENFEVLVDFDKLNEFKKNPNNFDVYDVLADYKIYKDEKKGLVASEKHLKEIFPGKSEEEIIKEILLKGECQIPTSYLNKLRTQKKEQVINYISQNAINPTTKTKYTESMIKTEIEKTKYSFDPFKDSIYQAEEVLKLLKKQIPIRMDKVILILEIPGEFAGNFYGPFRKFGTIKKEFYDSKGNLRIHIEVMESALDKVIDFVKEKTNNSAAYYVERNE
jgi:ribosome maturation protein SDO1